jgi:predicted GNAT superfamily acetyltransferase
LDLHALLGGGAIVINGASFNEAGLPVPPEDYVDHSGNLLLVEIPANFQIVKQKDFSLAKQWRLHTRFLFEELFQSGYVVTDFVHHSEAAGQPRSFYLLTHQDT